MAVAVDEHVLRLDIPMQDPGGVDVSQRREQLGGELLDRRRLAVAQQRREVTPLDVLHHQPGALARVVVIDGDQVRVLEGGGELRLAGEAPEIVVIGAERVGQDLDRHRATQALVGRQPDDCHAPVTEPALEHVAAADPATGGEQGRLGDRRRRSPPASDLELIGGLFVSGHDPLSLPAAGTR